jgi:hypothetical protein
VQNLPWDAFRPQGESGEQSIGLSKKRAGEMDLAGLPGCADEVRTDGIYWKGFRLGAG